MIEPLSTTYRVVHESGQESVKLTVEYAKGCNRITLTPPHGCRDFTFLSSDAQRTIRIAELIQEAAKFALCAAYKTNERNDR